MQSLDMIIHRNALAEQAAVRAKFPLAAPGDSLDKQIDALRERGSALIKLWNTNDTVKRGLPHGSWEEDRDVWCFCDAAPNGHELESITESGRECLFRDGELFDKLCPQCRHPATVYVTTQTGGEHDERWQQASTCCCGATPVRPSGTAVPLNECDEFYDEAE